MLESRRIWVAGHNLTGYLPESAPSYHLDWEGARDSLLWELNSLSDYYAEGLEQGWLDFYNKNPRELVLAFVGEVRGGTIEIPEKDEAMAESYQLDCVEYLAACDEAIEDLNRMTEPEAFSAFIEHRHYWIDNELLMHNLVVELVGDDKFTNWEEAIEAINEAAY